MVIGSGKTSKTSKINLQSPLSMYYTNLQKLSHSLIHITQFVYGIELAIEVDLWANTGIGNVLESRALNLEMSVLLSLWLLVDLLLLTLLLLLLLVDG